MRCTVCGAEGAVAVTVGGHMGTPKKDIGWAHDGTCFVVLWQSHWEETYKAPAWERAITAWEWRRQRARVEGRPFSEPYPSSRIVGCGDALV